MLCLHSGLNAGHDVWPGLYKVVREREKGEREVFIMFGLYCMFSCVFCGAVFGTEAWVRHALVRVPADHSWSYSADGRPYLWKVSYFFVSLTVSLILLYYTLVWCVCHVYSQVCGCVWSTRSPVRVLLGICGLFLTAGSGWQHVYAFRTQTACCVHACTAR